MYCNKFSKRLIMLSACIALAVAQGAFAAEVKTDAKAAVQAPVAQAPAVVKLSLQDAMQRAFDTNPAVTMAVYNRQSAKAAYNAAKAGFLPSVTLSHKTSRGGYDEEVYGTGSKNITNTNATSIAVEMPVFTGGALEGASQVKKASYKVAVESEQSAYNDLRSSVTNGYYKLLAAENGKKLAQDSVDRMTQHLKNVQAQYDVGVVARVDLLRSQVELANAQQTLISAVNGRDLAEASLNNIVGLPLNTPLQLDNILTYQAYDKDMQYCLDFSKDHRPELKQAQYKVDAMLGALTAAKASLLPKVAIGASKGWQSEHWPAYREGIGSWTAYVGASWNIFDSGVTISKIHGAEADLHNAEENLRNTQNLINLDVRQCYFNMREAEKRIATTSTVLESAQEDYRISQVRYLAGVGTNTDVMDASVALTNAQNNHLTALYDYNKSKTDLMTAIGDPMVVPHKIKVEAPAIKAAEAEMNKK